MKSALLSIVSNWGRPTEVEAEIPRPAEKPAAPAPAPARDSGLDLVEADVLTAIGSVGASIAAARSGVGDVHVDLMAIRGETGALAEAARGASIATSDLAERTGGLSSASIEIDAAMAGAATFLSDASDRGAEARAIISSLAEASAEIAGIVDVISAVAAQTSLLALNATIEAARAGEAGRGFAVVAKEVKALSIKTAKAVEDVQSRVEKLRAGASASAAAIEMAAAAIDHVRPAFATVRSAADAQAETVARIVGEARQASDLVSTVSDGAEGVSLATLKVDERTRGVEQAAAHAATQAENLGRRFTAVIRQSELGDRRRHDRFPVELPVRLPGGGRAHTVDLSAGGMLVSAPDSFRPGLGADLALDVEGIGLVPCRVAGISHMGVHCAFEAAPQDVATRLAARLGEIEAGYRPLILRAQDVAGRIAALMTGELDAGRLSEAELFDVDYRPIEGTDPQQYDTASVAPLRRLLSPMLEAELATDAAMLFCIVTDRNGFLPVHNLKVSHPQRPGDPVWNDANCRNQRIFDDRTGIIAARSTRPATVQAYRRAVGAQAIMVREVDAPIRIRDRHWGAARTAYRL